MQQALNIMSPSNSTTLVFTKRLKLEGPGILKLRSEKIQWSDDNRTEIAEEPTSRQDRKEEGGCVDAEQAHQ